MGEASSMTCCNTESFSWSWLHPTVRKALWGPGTLKGSHGFTIIKALLFISQGKGCRAFLFSCWSLAFVYTCICDLPQDSLEGVYLHRTRLSKSTCYPTPVSGLLHKHQDLSLDPQQSWKKHVPMTSELGLRKQEDLWGSLAIRSSWVSKFSPQGWASQLVFSILWNPEEVCQWRNGLAHESKQAKSQKSSFFHVLYIGCQLKVWPRLKVYLSPSKIQIGSGSSHFKWFI